jgi:lysophospholipase L1-like esterase
MNYTKLRVGALAAVALTIAAVACTDDSVDVLAPTPAANPIFQRYVALGNSITAGYQSSGINDSTQRQSYARLLAAQMHTSYVYPALLGAGCAPPIVNFQTQARYLNGASNDCHLRDASTTLRVQNNVAVPGATSFDPTATTTKASNILTQLFLGGETQVQRALDAHPTFATVWIGNNDVLDAAAKGVTVYQSATDAGSVAVKTALSTQGITDTITFVKNYKAMIDQLTAGAPGLKGVLIGVVNVTQIPFIFSIDSLIGEPTTKAYFDAAVGHTTTITPDCAGSGALVTLGMIQFLKANPTAPLSCTKGAVPTAPAIGDFFILDVADQALFNKVITRYNGYIKAKADSIGFAYFDPNPLLGSLKGVAGGIPSVPVLSSPTATFGPYISLDGIHPSGKAHIAIANALISVINAKYTTSLTPVTP